jgi:hypothetical protein
MDDRGRGDWLAGGVDFREEVAHASGRSATERTIAKVLAMVCHF